MIEIGTKAPDFALKDQNGRITKLASFRGNWGLCFPSGLWHGQLSAMTR
jgi:peroxiredoxin